MTSSARGRDISRPEFIALVAALMALNALAIDIMLPALPAMGEALGVSNENERQFVITAYMLGFGMAQLVFGPLSDRFGRRAPLLVGLVIYIAAAGLAVFAPNFGVLLALRFIQGAGAAGTRVIATSVVRDKYHGREMAEVMSLTFMVFMVIPVIAPSVGQLVLLNGPWQMIFLFMAGLAFIFTIWAFIRLPETLAPENVRPLRFSVVTEGFRLVFTNRAAFFYGIAGMLIFGGLFGFITTAQQIFVDVFGLGVWFPLAFAVMAGFMALSSFLNARVVRRVGMRRLSHGALLFFTTVSAIWVVLALTGVLPFWLFFVCLVAIMASFGLAASNMNSLSMEPLGNVAGTAAAVFGFIQTVGGALLGSIIGQQFNGTTLPTALGYFTMGLLAIGCVLIAERGKLFGVGDEYAGSDHVPEPAH